MLDAWWHSCRSSFRLVEHLVLDSTLLLLCHCTTVPLCPCAPVPLCHGAPVPCTPVLLSCAPVPLGPCANVPLCTCAPLPLCLCAPVPLCDCAPMPMFPCAMCPVPLCPLGDCRRSKNDDSFGLFNNYFVVDFSTHLLRAGYKKVLPVCLFLCSSYPCPWMDASCPIFQITAP